MAQNKTIETSTPVALYLQQIKDGKRQRDMIAMVDLISKHTGLEAKMWGTAIVGFGSYHYKYESGREGSAPLAGISSRANAISLYLSSVFDNRDELLSEFGKYKTAKACIYIQKLEDIDQEILIKMVKNSIQYYRKKYPLKD